MEKRSEKYLSCEGVQRDDDGHAAICSHRQSLRCNPGNQDVVGGAWGYASAEHDHLLKNDGFSIGKMTIYMNKTANFD